MRRLTVAAAEVEPAGSPARGAQLALCDPVTRRYTADGRLAASEPGGPDAVVDVLELTDAEQRALVDDEAVPPEPMLVLGSFATLEGASTLGRFLVGGAVLDTNVFDGHRCPSEQTALGLWRIARLRGGAFWEGVAELVAAWVEDRVRSARGVGPVHGVWGQGETHVRFLADAALLLLASGREPAASRAVTLLEGFGVPYGSGRWYVHDSLELERSEPDLVLNTHAQVMAVLAAAGRPVAEATRALEAALARRPTGAARGPALAAAGALGVADLLRSRAPARLQGLGGRMASWGERGVAAAHGHRAFVRLPGGGLARDASAHRAPHYYAGVNLYDLGVLVANGVVDAGGPAAVAFRDALRWAAGTGTFAALRRSGVGIAALEPIVWQQAGRADRAATAARRLLAAGRAAAPGWPGHTDAPWPAFSAGTA